MAKARTLGLVMLSTDKTQLTNHSGDKQAHCVYLSCGNIDKDIRTKVSARCWVKVAEIPIVKFKQKEFQGILSQRLYHQCMDIVTKSLKEASHEPIEIADANGDVHLERTILLALLADNLEQQMIACCSGDASPISLARHKELGLRTPRALRTGVGTLERIHAATEATDPHDLSRYKPRALKAGLNGVTKPFWRDWKFADPSIFLAPDALHQWHKFFWDHLMRWARALLGNNELDHRYKALQKHVQHRHFSKGFTSFSQHTCREFRDLEASFIAVISGHPKITTGIMMAFRAMLDFIYIAQFDTQTSSTLEQLEDAIQRFHKYKIHISIAGLRNGPRRRESSTSKSWK